MTPPLTAILTPCTGVCTLDQDGYCLGCHRSVGEIAGWSQLSDDERRRVMEVVLPLREAARS